MGSLAAKLGPSDDYVEQVANYWQRVGAEFRNMPQIWTGADVYQDGLPDAAPEIVARIVADVDSPNYRLLRWLISAGATAIGTEDPVLLQEEYELLKASIADEAARRAYAQRAAGLLAERDRYIAGRIDENLTGEGTGVLFIGLQHRVLQALPADIKITSLRSCQELLPGLSRLVAGQRSGSRPGRDGPPA